MTMPDEPTPVMTPEVAIYIYDAAILIALAREDQLDLLVRTPRSTFHLNVQLLQTVDFLTFCRVRKFVLGNFGQVRLIGSDGYLPETKGDLVCDFLTEHRELAAAQAQASDWSGRLGTRKALWMLCLDVHATSERIADAERVRVQNLPIPIKRQLMTLASFKSLVNVGLRCNSLPTPARKGDAKARILRDRLGEPADDSVRQLYDPAQLEDMCSKLQLQPNDTKDILRRNLTQMRALGPYRTYAPAPCMEALDLLQQQFPNFCDVIEAISRGIVLSRLSKNPMAHAQPILLCGEPGIGKTAFARALAATFATHFFEIRMNSLTAGFSIGGHDLSWSNGRPGILFNEVGLRKIINPIGLLDEIDKVGPRREYDPTGHLFTLLESDTARRFQDEAIPLAIDLSHVTWIATANEIDTIEPPLLSRFTSFQIPAPTPAQARVIARNMYTSLLEEESWGRHFLPLISDDALDVITNASPREVRKLLLDALGNAATEKRTQLLVSDFRISRPGSRMHRIGFY